VNKIKRPTNVMGIFSREVVLLRLAGSVLIEVHDSVRQPTGATSEASMAKLVETRNDALEGKDVGKSAKRAARQPTTSNNVADDHANAVSSHNSSGAAVGGLSPGAALSPRQMERALRLLP
jgi:hypothetical protein